jgi:ribonuclease-3
MYKNIQKKNYQNNNINEVKIKENNKSIDAILLYKFSNSQLLENALLHPSKEKNSQFQRLELLGDKLLNFHICEKIFHLFPEKNEGELSILLSHLISATVIHEITSPHISHNINYTGSLNSSMVADTFEAIIGAIYLDSENNFSIINNIIDILWLPYINKNKNIDFKSPKNKLQEMGGNYTCNMEESYEKLETNNNNNNHNNIHKKKFKVEMISNGVKAIGEGFSKKEATSNGALDLLRKLEAANKKTN